ncbi:unnamed protein product [Rhodiola kirilowii]
MVSMEIEQERESAEHATCKSPDNTITSPRISFSCDLSDDDASFISINLEPIKTEDDNDAKQSTGNFEFLQADNRTQQREMPTADELFFEGKLLPYWQTHDQSEKLRNLSLKSEKMEETGAKGAEEAESRVRTWFIDDDPSPRPPKCTVLWKELLRLKSRQKGSTLSPSSSSSSSSSSSNSLDMSKEKSRESNGGISNGKNNNVKRVKKGLERTRSASIRIRPMVNVPICTHSAKQSSLPPLCPMRRGAR